MTNVTIEEARAKLSELIDHVKGGDEVVITRDDQPVARLIATVCPAQQPRRLGSLQGTVTYMAPDFDAPLEDFEEYMQ